MPSKHRHFRCQITWNADNFGARNFEHGTRLATHFGYVALGCTDVTNLIKTHLKINPYLHLMHAVVVDWESPGLGGRFQLPSVQQRRRRTTSGEGVTSRVQGFLEDARKLVPRVQYVRVRLAV